MAIFLKNRKKSNTFIITNIFFLLLGCAFLFAFLEEISWGQRIFNFSTPQFLQGINQQNELNLHNLESFHGITESGERKSFWALLINFDRIFSLFWLSFCCLLPLLYKLHSQTKRTLDRFNFPIVPLFLGFFFIINYLLSKMFEFQIDSTLTHSLVEIKESGFAFLFFLVGIWFIKSSKKNNPNNVI